MQSSPPQQLFFFFKWNCFTYVLWQWLIHWSTVFVCFKLCLCVCFCACVLGCFYFCFVCLSAFVLQFLPSACRQCQVWQVFGNNFSLRFIIVVVVVVVVIIVWCSVMPLKFKDFCRNAYLLCASVCVYGF